MHCRHARSRMRNRSAHNSNATIKAQHMQTIRQLFEHTQQHKYDAINTTIINSYIIAFGQYLDHSFINTRLQRSPRNDQPIKQQ